jgi:hypothetical protein
MSRFFGAVDQFRSYRPGRTREAPIFESSGVSGRSISVFSPFLATQCALLRGEAARFCASLRKEKLSPETSDEKSLLVSILHSRARHRVTPQDS